MLAYPACSKEPQMQFSHQPKWITRKLQVYKIYKYKLEKTIKPSPKGEKLLKISGKENKFIYHLYFSHYGHHLRDLYY